MLFCFPALENLKSFRKRQWRRKPFSHQKKRPRVATFAGARTKSENQRAWLLRGKCPAQYDQRQALTPRSQSKANCGARGGKDVGIKSLGNSPSNRLFSIDFSFASNKNLIFKRPLHASESKASRLLADQISRLRKRISKRPKAKAPNSTPKPPFGDYAFKTPERVSKDGQPKRKAIEESSKRKKKAPAEGLQQARAGNSRTARKPNSFQFSLDFLNADVLETLKKARPRLSAGARESKQHSAILNQNVVSYKSNNTLLTLDGLNHLATFGSKELADFFKDNASSGAPLGARSKLAREDSQSTFALCTLGDPRAQAKGPGKAK